MFILCTNGNENHNHNQKLLKTAKNSNNQNQKVLETETKTNSHFAPNKWWVQIFKSLNYEYSQVDGSEQIVNW